MKFFKKIKLFNNKKKLIRNTKIFSLIIFVLSFGLITYVFSEAKDSMSGFGWSASYVDLNINNSQDINGEYSSEVTGGMGWLSFNCVDQDSGFDTCSVYNDYYGVNINEDGFLEGLAWSPNYGWLKFGGLTNMPYGGENAKFVGTINQNGYNGELQGFARFCAPANNPNPEDCSGFAINNSNGGWDGWVKLDGETYGVEVSNNILSGYGWGGNDGNTNFVGWIDFSGVKIKPPVVVSLSAEPATVNENATMTDLIFTANLSAPVSTPTTITLQYSGTATHNTDYNGDQITQITFEPNEIEKTITTFNTVNDEIQETPDTESIVVTITNVLSGNGVVINDFQKTDFITIIDDDEGGGNPPGGTSGGKPKYKEN